MVLTDEKPLLPTGRPSSATSTAAATTRARRVKVVVATTLALLGLVFLGFVLFRNTHSRLGWQDGGDAVVDPIPEVGADTNDDDNKQCSVKEEVVVSGYSYWEGSEWDGVQGYLGPFPRCNRHQHHHHQGGGGRRVYATLLMTEPYLTGVLKWACSLRQVNSGYGLLVLHPPTISEATLATLGRHDIETRVIELIRFPNSFADRFQINWTKLRLWQLTEFSKIVYMDSDTFVLQNVDELFEIDAPFAIPADTERKCYQCSPMGYNQAGVFVMEPCQATFDDMMCQINSDAGVRFENSDSEQGFFNYYFQYQRHLLPPDYSFLPHQFWDTPLRERAKVLHYTMFKPWLGASSRKDYHDAWFKCQVADVDPVYNE